MKKLLFTIMILATTILVSLENPVSAQSESNEDAITTNNFDDAIKMKKKFLRDILEETDFSNIDLKTDIVLTQKKPVKWENVDNEGNYLCTSVWKMKKFIFFKKNTTWILETSEIDDGDNCQQEEDYIPYYDLRSFQSVKNEEFKREFIKAALASQEQIIKSDPEYEANFANRVMFFKFKNGFSAMANNVDYGIKTGTSTNSWNIYEDYEQVYDIKDFESADLSMEKLIHRYTSANVPYVSYYSRTNSMIGENSVKTIELKNGISLKDLIAE